jgi:hypothetical protein
MQRLARPALVALALTSLLAACGSPTVPQPAGTAPPAPTPAITAAAAVPASTGAPSTAADAPSAAAPAGSPTPSPDPVTERVRAAITAADLREPATIDAVDAVRFVPGAAETASQAIADGASGDALWAATWVYASSGSDPAPLLPLLAHDDPSIRAMAAAALLADGDADGAVALAGLLRVEERLQGSIPPVTVGQYAASSLARLLDGPPATPGAGSAAVAEAWTRWLGQHGPALSFDAATGTWAVP